MPDPCRAKMFYDTEAAATVAAARVSAKWQTAMAPYACGTHWHIAHEDPSLRSRQRSYDKTYCEVCRSYMKALRYPTHVTRPGHQMRLRQKAKETQE